MKRERPPEIVQIDVGASSERRAPLPPDRAGVPDERLFPEAGEVDVARILTGVLGRWRLVLLVAVIVVGAGIYPVAVLLAPNHVSRAAISAVERSALLDEPWAPPPGPKLSETSLLELVESREVMERAEQKLGLEVGLLEMRRRIGIEWPRDQDVFFITAGLPEAEEAQRWAQAASEAFLERAHERFRRDLQQSIDRLTEKLETVRAELDEKTQAVLTFRQENALTGADAAPEELIKQLVEMETRIAGLRALGTADQKAAGAIRTEDAGPRRPSAGPPAARDDAGAEGEGDGGAGGGMSRAVWRARVTEVRKELLELERRYTAEHPRVVAVRQELTNLQKLERSGAVAAPRRGGGGPDRPRRPDGWTEAEMTLSAEHRMEQAASLEEAAQDLRRRIDTYTQTRRQLELLEAEVATVKARWQKIRDDLDKARALMVLRAPLYDVVKAAEMPDRPEGGRRRIAAAGLLLLGLGLGTGIALWRSIRDTSVRTAHDLERLGLPVLATATLGAASLGRTAHREAMRLVAQTLRRELRGVGESRCVLVTSPNPSEGKSQVATDVCKELIRWGEGVVLVDGNLRGGDRREGQLDGYLLGRVANLVPAADEWGIPKVTAGNVGDEAPELLSRQGLRRALRLAASRGFSAEDSSEDVPGPGFRPAGATGNLCVVDGPAFLPSVDAELLAEASDAVLLVAQSGRSRIEQVQEVVSRVRDAGRPLLGAVLARSGEKRNMLARLLLGPRSLALALLSFGLLLGAAGCGPSRNLAEDSIEESNADALRAESLFLPVGEEMVDLAPFRVPPDAPYVIGAGDVLEIAVIGYPESSRGGVLVRPDGRIGVPLVGDVLAAGRTPTDVAAELTESLGRYLKGPVVGVLVQEARNARVLVLGMVRSPGAFVLTGPTRLLEILALAGGLAYRDELGAEPVIADLTRATLIRGDKLVPVDFRRLLLGGDSDQNVYVEAGDVVHLPPLLERDVLVLGEVQGPTVIRYSRQLTLATALARAGGVTQEARTGAVRVIRGSLAKPRVYLVDVDDIFAAQRPDVPLLPGDIVYVTTTAIADWNRLLEQILPTIQAALTTRYLIEGTPRPLFD